MQIDLVLNRLGQAGWQTQSAASSDARLQHVQRQHAKLAQLFYRSPAAVQHPGADGGGRTAHPRADGLPAEASDFFPDRVAVMSIGVPVLGSARVLPLHRSQLRVTHDGQTLRIRAPVTQSSHWAIVPSVAFCSVAIVRAPGLAVACATGSKAAIGCMVPWCLLWVYIALRTFLEDAPVARQLCITPHEWHFTNVVEDRPGMHGAVKWAGGGGPHQDIHGLTCDLAGVKVRVNAARCMESSCAAE